MKRLPPKRDGHHLDVINAVVKQVREERSLPFSTTWVFTVRRVLQDLRPTTVSFGKGLWALAEWCDETETEEVS